MKDCGTHRIWDARKVCHRIPERMVWKLSEMRQSTQGEIIGWYKTGLVNVSFWGFWPSPSNICWRWNNPNSWVMWLPISGTSIPSPAKHVPSAGFFSGTTSIHVSHRGVTGSCPHFADVFFHSPWGVLRPWDLWRRMGTADKLWVFWRITRLS